MYIYFSYCIYDPLLSILYLSVNWVMLKVANLLYPKLISLQEPALFHTPFYTLFVASAVSDLVMVAITFYDLRCTFFPITSFMFTENSPSNAWRQARLAYASDTRNYQNNNYCRISFVCPMFQDLVHFCIACNRYNSETVPA
ncbi:hypothetical protein PRIPAC_79832 [Pristionchus pacificus]|uniref:Uncharacterized protein n=1 Tax=Pristionchus pacificus TaxID=54126 RepID=A0A2A6CK98_PRIPA|nr:hypothetical protein PRIPAC_79832 [Pristionchus pacificus]|eukprot:PDM78530.1 hypothetical protein PRIPAC_31109 [Pristionchus pacificus]